MTFGEVPKRLLQRPAYHLCTAQSITLTTEGAVNPVRRSEQERSASYLLIRLLAAAEPQHGGRSAGGVVRRLEPEPATSEGLQDRASQVMAQAVRVIAAAE